MILGKRWDIYNLQLWNLGLGGPLSWSSVQGIPGYGLRWYGLRLTTNSDFIVGGPLTQRSLLPKSSSPPPSFVDSIAVSVFVNIDWVGQILISDLNCEKDRQLLTWTPILMTIKGVISWCGIHRDFDTGEGFKIFKRNVLRCCKERAKTIQSDSVYQTSILCYFFSDWMTC